MGACPSCGFAFAEPPSAITGLVPVTVTPTEPDALADAEHLTWAPGWLAALRGDALSARAMLAGLQDLYVSEDPQDQAMLSLA